MRKRIRSKAKTERTVDRESPSSPEGLPPSAEWTKIPTKRKVEDAWTPKLVKQGFVGIARTFLRQYGKLRPHITHGEAMFIVHLMDYKWDAKAPFPSYKTLAGFMGVSTKQARRLAKSLEEKKYLRRDIREATTNLFYLDALFEALEKRI
jgi:hypothetical protein